MMQVQSAAMWRGSLAPGTCLHINSLVPIQSSEIRKGRVQHFSDFLNTKGCPQRALNRTSLPISDVLPGDRDLSAAALGPG